MNKNGATDSGLTNETRVTFGLLYRFWTRFWLNSGDFFGRSFKFAMAEDQAHAQNLAFTSV
jgi:hypothetical protein